MHRKSLAAATLLAVSACTAAQIQDTSAAVQAGCAEALPLANLAIFIPTIGPAVAAGVQVGCGTASGVAKLVGDPSSAAWLGQQSQILKTALGKL
jgi:hypothetical protein